MTERWLVPGDDLTDAFNIRRTVFIEEQGFSVSEEMDGRDASSFHLLLYDKDIPVACGRIIVDEDFYIGRVAVIKAIRGTGLGALLMKKLIKRCEGLGAGEIHLGAQRDKRGFYEKMGFSAYGESYMDGHVEHVHMKYIV